MSSYLEGKVKVIREPAMSRIELFLHVVLQTVTVTNSYSFLSLCKMKNECHENAPLNQIFGEVLFELTCACYLPLGRSVLGQTVADVWARNREHSFSQYGST